MLSTATSRADKMRRANEPQGHDHLRPDRRRRHRGQVRARARDAEQIAEAGIAAARAGATIVHVHVRDPQTWQGSREVAFYREAVERIRASDVDVIINTTAGMGGDLMLDPQHPTSFVEGTDLVSGVERLKHVEELLPEICTLDCGSLNFGDGSLVYVSTPDMLRDGAKRIQELGVRVEMAIFDTGSRSCPA